MKKIKKTIPGLCAGLTLFAGLSAQNALAAQQDDDPTMAFVFENDWFASEDYNYTSGVKLTHLSGTREPEGLGRAIADQIFNLDMENAVAWRGFGIGQSLYTPKDTEATAPVPGQHPYAAFLYGEYTSIVASGNHLTQFTAEVGMVGESALGEEVQNFVHDANGGDEANGWDNQIGDELAIALTLDKRRRVGTSIGLYDIAVDVISGYGATVGNYRTDAHAALTFRVGDNLKNDYGPLRVLPGLGGTSYFAEREGFSWHFFTGVEGRAVAHSMVLDGSFLDEDDVTVESRDFVGDLQAGLVLQHGPLQVSYIHVYRSSEFKDSGGSDEFGALSFALKLKDW